MDFMVGYYPTSIKLFHIISLHEITALLLFDVKYQLCVREEYSVVNAQN